MSRREISGASPEFCETMLIPLHELTRTPGLSGPNRLRDARAGGNVRVKPAPNEGSTVRFTLPAA